MTITPEDRIIFQHAVELFKDDDPIRCCVLLKVLHTFLQKTSPLTVDLPSNLKDLLENRRYSENPEVFKELKKCWSIIADVAQDEEQGN